MSNYPSLLPIGSTDLEKDLEQMGFFSNHLEQLDLSMIHDPYRCPASMLSWLAWTRHVDFYDESWPETKKRDVIFGAPKVHLTKGTIFSIREVVRFAGYGEIEIVTQEKSADLSWAQYTVILEKQVTTRQAQIIRALINTTAPARCELVEMTYGQSIIYNGLHKYDGQFSYGVD